MDEADRADKVAEVDPGATATTDAGAEDGEMDGEATGDGTLLAFAAVCNLLDSDWPRVDSGGCKPLSKEVADGSDGLCPTGCDCVRAEMGCCSEEEAEVYGELKEDELDGARPTTVAGRRWQTENTTAASQQMSGNAVSSWVGERCGASACSQSAWLG